MTIPFREWFVLDESNLDEVDDAIPEIVLSFPRRPYEGPLDNVRGDDGKARARFSFHKAQAVIAFDYGDGEASMFIGNKLYWGQCNERSDGRWQFELVDGGFMDADANDIEED